MQAGMLRRLTLVLVLLALTGCQHSQSALVKITPIPPPQPFVFYDNTGEPSGRTAPLSDAELRGIIEWVAAHTSDRVWLIRVRPSPEKGMRNNMVAYLIPDEATPRIRAGRAYDIPASLRQTDSRPPWKYAQVSMPHYEFTAALTKPSATEMPFEWPAAVDPSSKKTSPMPGGEIVALSDFLRQLASSMPVKNTFPDQAMARDSLKLPILTMSDMGEKVGVSFGFLHEDLWGGGVNVMVERTREGYKALDWTYWVS